MSSFKIKHKVHIYSPDDLFVLSDYTNTQSAAPDTSNDGFERFKEYMEGIGCDKVELQKAIDKLTKLTNEQKKHETLEESIGSTDRAHELFEPDLTETFEESENIKTLETNQHNMQAQYDCQPTTSGGIEAAGFTRLVIADSDSDSENTGLFMTT